MRCGTDWRRSTLLAPVWEMARLSDLEGGVCTADSALGLMPELRDAIEELAERYHRYPDANRARLVIRLADGRSGSAGESVTRVQFLSLQRAQAGPAI